MVALQVWLAIMNHGEWGHFLNTTNQESLTSPRKETMCWKRKERWMTKHIETQMSLEAPHVCVSEWRSFKRVSASRDGIML
jgi:hypothetical protein